MTGKSYKYKRELFNQFINLFWTIVGFTPVLWFWIKEGITLYFYLFAASAVLIGILPERWLHLFILSSNRHFYEQLGVKHIRKFVQNGDTVKAFTKKEKHVIIGGVSQAQQYLKTIEMYERYHWFCFSFFLLTALYCLFHNHWKLGLAIMIANLLYNVSSILLQQYNKIRIKKIIC